MAIDEAREGIPGLRHVDAPALSLAGFGSEWQVPSMPEPDPSSLESLRAGLAGRYEIERELGAGGMAVVYLARDTARSRRVALKVLRPVLGSIVGGDRFQREIALVAQLVHPHILPLLDSGETAGRLWFTMPFIEGESLRAWLGRETQLPLGDAVRLTREVAGALTHAHARGILHRDIKPDNILLADGHALLADFGIARAVAGETGEQLTGTGIAVGTPGYMSPEQSTADRHLDARSDVYALASVCYEMLAGEPPFTGPTAQVVIARRLSQPPPSLRTTRPGVPEAVDAVVRRGLASAPADRYATAADFSAALGAAAGGGSHAPRARSRWLLPAVAAVTLLALGVAGYRRMSPRPPPRAAEAEGGIRLAVVPFRLIGHDSADQYLADGISQEINSTLSNLSGLRVIAQSSVAPAAETARGLRELGAALGADALVEGDVQHAGTQVRVRVRLIDPATEETRWSQEFDHTTRDVFRIQSEVGTRVAALLRIQLAERESRSLGRPPTTNPEAYDWYLRGRAQGDRTIPTLGELDSTVTNLTRAIELDSTFALAWALRARALQQAVFAFDGQAARVSEAESDVARALALDSTLAVAWQVRGSLAWNAVTGWNFAQALADTRRALAIRPSDADAHAGLGSLYFHYGFPEEAARELALSLSLDPRDGCDNPARCAGFSRPRIARTFWYRQQFESALAVYRRMPFLGPWTSEYAVVLNGVGRPGEGLALLDSTSQAGRNVAQEADREAARGLMYAALGRPDQALVRLRAAAAKPISRSHFHHAQFTIACAYARLGRKADAVGWLERAADNGLPNYPLFRNDPNLKSLQGDAAYEEFMRRLKGQYEQYAALVHAQPAVR